MAAIELSAAAFIAGILVSPLGGVLMSPLGIPPLGGVPGKSPLPGPPCPPGIPPIPPVCIGRVAKMYLSVLYAEPYVVPNALIASVTADDEVS